ncbi:hypothetical protein [Nocardiopsis nanhaiensis]
MTAVLWGTAAALWGLVAVLAAAARFTRRLADALQAALADTGNPPEECVTCAAAPVSPPHRPAKVPKPA